MLRIFGISTCTKRKMKKKNKAPQKLIYGAYKYEYYLPNLGPVGGLDALATSDNIMGTSHHR